MQAADGTGDAVRIATAEVGGSYGSWSSDGRMLLFDRVDSSTGNDIWMVGRDSGTAPQPFLQTRFNEFSPRLSPDSRWIAYVSNESGRNEVYLRRFPDASAKRQISTGGGDVPAWSRDGRRLFFSNGEQMMAVEISGGTEVVGSQPRLLFKGAYLRRGAGLNYDVAPDGRHFAMIVPAEPESLHEIALVTNWFEDLKRRVPR